MLNGFMNAGIYFYRRILLAVIFCSIVCTDCSALDYYTDQSHHEFLQTKSYVYFYRPCLIWGAGKNIVVRDEQKNLGELHCGTYFIYETSPGARNFFAFGKHIKHALQLDLEPGKKYFVKVDYGLGLIDRESTLTLMGNIREPYMARFKEVLSAEDAPRGPKDIKEKEEFFRYQEELRGRIAHAIQGSDLKGESKILVKFTLNSNGTLQKIKVIALNRKISQQLINAWTDVFKRTFPFKPFPKFITEPTLDFNVILDISL
jgi:hypothetical protein